MKQVIRTKPIAEQVADILQDRIFSRIYPINARMPSEDDLADELQVSRATVRSALSHLAAIGLVDRRQGDGTYPQTPAVELHLQPVKNWDIERQIRESGRDPSMSVIDFQERPPNTEEAEKLKLQNNKPILFISRMFYADRKPVGLIENCLPLAAIKQPLTKAEAALSPVEFFKRCLATPIQKGQSRFTASLADLRLAGLFEIPQGDPLLYLTSLVVDSNEVPIIYAREIYPGSEGFSLQLHINPSF